MVIDLCSRCSDQFRPCTIIEIDHALVKGSCTEAMKTIVDIYARRLIEQKATVEQRWSELLSSSQECSGDSVRKADFERCECRMLMNVSCTWSDRDAFTGQHNGDI